MNSNNNNKKSLNDNLINIGIVILCIIMIISLIVSFIVWKRTNDLTFVISGFICVVGILFNIYLLSRAKSKKKE
ncbi:hypothetical protein [Clostridium saccharoperbutylacetonicum]|uniref:hypothetical protein n=1 Tax=Clostridium saccharoperbutylacetonicum TaxID=36745 RepID=UPI000983EEBF|nr:hypothetical protein [Clostridium saccharoperbutylacetonicum]AQR98098.1 hypothetical protein CLSAP_54490 [Clostridium saccharoperbutylacetonicum]NSB33992.1 hypothetical protein [Clostridium saccharoperbutylacetonicum]